MTKKILIVLGAFLAMTFFSTQVNAQVDKIIGTWKTIDDETGEAKSYVKIVKSQKNGKYYGKIIKLLKKSPDQKCTECKGKLKGKKIVGMYILTAMKEDGDGLKGGKILDPNNGKFYHCSMKLQKGNSDKLDVRGSVDSWGFAGRTQTWHRLKK